MLEVGRQRADKQGVGNVEFVEGNAETLKFPDTQFRRLYDRIRHPQRAAHRRRAARGVSRAEAGRAVSFAWSFRPSTCRDSTEFTELYSFNVIPAMGRAVTGDAESYRYLVKSIRKFPRPNIFAEMIRDAGFRQVKFTPMTGGIVALHSGWRL